MKPLKPRQFFRSTLVAVYTIGFSASHSVYANEVDVIKVDYRCNSEYQCHFSVTLQHQDSGWDHYADRWEVVASDGTVLATRTLLHPHVNEQPFTRSLGPVQLPKGTEQVSIRAHDSVHEYGGKSIQLAIKVPSR